MNFSRAISLSVLTLVSLFVLATCSKGQPASGFAAAEPECRGVLLMQPPGYETSKVPLSIDWKEFMRTKTDAWTSGDIHAAAIERLGAKREDFPSASMKLHVEPQPGTLLLNVWCTGGTLSQRHDFLEAAMDAFIETHGLDPKLKPWDKMITEVSLADDNVRRIREEITSAREKSPPDDAAEKVLREKLETAKVQLQEKRQAVQAAPPIPIPMLTATIGILTPPQKLPSGS